MNSIFNYNTLFMDDYQRVSETLVSINFKVTFQISSPLPS